jgi:uncharacterized protein (TIGR03067 family)
MTCKTRIALLFTLAVIAPGFWLSSARGDAKDASNIDGTWVPSAAELAGQKYPDEVNKTIKLVVKDNQYTVTVGEAPPDKGTVKLNASASPCEMDITGTEGPNKGRTFLTIYQRDGDTLRICYDLSCKSRPTEFKSTEGTKLFLVTYERQKPSAK